MLKLGVVSGMGPFAANFFIKRVLEITDAPKEWDHFRIFADYNVYIPSRTRALLFDEASPAPGIIETINGLENMGADIVAVPCNSAHGWYDEVSKSINIPWIDMISITSNEVVSSGINKCLLFSAYVPTKLKLYEKYIDVEYPCEEDKKKTYELIERLKVGEDREIIKNEFYDIVKCYDDTCDGVITACTELSMLFSSNDHKFGKFELIDSTNVYAKYCVKICKG